MLKLYRFTEREKEYWETWDNENGSHTVHWGKLGERGESKIVKSTLFKKAETIIQGEIDRFTAQGFRPVEDDDHFTLMTEYLVDRMGTEEDLEKRQRLESRLNQTLGWAGLGHCDGGSIGSGTMEVCRYVVDYDLAKRIIEKDLANTEFANFTRIYNENE